MTMLTCDDCKKTFETYRQLNGHKRIHGKSKGHYSVSRKNLQYLRYTCLHCGSTGTLYPNDINKDFCSKICKDLYKWKTEGILDVILGNGTKENIVRYFKEENLYFCKSCNTTHWKGKKLKLIMLYKDGNKNNKITENIEFLCPNCFDIT